MGEAEPPSATGGGGGEAGSRPTDAEPTSPSAPDEENGLGPSLYEQLERNDVFADYPLVEDEVLDPAPTPTTSAYDLNLLEVAPTWLDVRSVRATRECVANRQPRTSWRECDMSTVRCACSSLLGYYNTL